MTNDQKPLPSIEELIGPKLTTAMERLEHDLSRRGGPAFPLGFIEIAGKTGFLVSGMTIRDYMASAVLPSLILRARPNSTATAIVQDAYKFADAMLRERDL